MIEVLRVFAILCVAFVMGKLVARVRLPAILGWLIAGVVFGPYLAGVVTLDIMDTTGYKIAIKAFECFAGVMIGKEILFRELAKTGKQILGITFIQSIGTFVVVSLVFAVVFWFMGIPLYLALIFGGIALATAPAPALSIVNEYHTHGPVTKTLIPLAALDDVIGVVVFFTVISVVSAVKGTESESVGMILLSVLLPFVIGIGMGWIASRILKRIQGETGAFILFLLFLCLSAVTGILTDWFLFHAWKLNYILIGMSFSAAVVNGVPAEKMEPLLKKYNPILSLSLVLVIVNLGMPLDYRLIASAGLFTVLYMVSRAVGKIGGAYVGGKVTGAPETVTKYLGFTLLPHSGVSLVFTGIAATTLNGIDPSLAAMIQGTIVAAAIINEIIAVLVAKYAFVRAGEIGEEAPGRKSARRE
ncbi:MAG: cation:proton antiporter [Candidatus Heritagella sp.]